MVGPLTIIKLASGQPDADGSTSTASDNGWRYEFWLKSEDRIVYAIHGGPMAGRWYVCVVAYRFAVFGSS